MRRPRSRAAASWWQRHEVVVTIGTVLFGQYCRQAADQTHVNMGFSPDYQSLRVTSEVTTEPVPTLHLTMSSTVSAGLP
jgi:hypothetical protein